MTVSKLLERYQANQPTEASDQDSIDDQGAFGIVRSQRERAIMLELRKKDGSITAIPYALIEEVRFSPSDGITIEAAGRSIHIAGRHLNLTGAPRISLFSGLCRQRIVWIQECSGSAALETPVSTPRIESIVM